MNRRLALLLVVAMLAALCAGCGGAEETTITTQEAIDAKTMLAPYLDKVTDMTTKEVPYYAAKKENESKVTLHFFNGQEDIPYVDGETLAHIVTEASRGLGQKDYSVTAESVEGTLILTRENGAMAVADPRENAILFTDYDLFWAPPGAVNDLDVIQAMGTGSEPYLLRHTSLFLRQGDPTIFSLSDYQIQLVEWEGTCYIPLQTAVDVLRMSGFTLYNGETLIFTEETVGADPKTMVMYQSELGELYSSVTQEKKSEALTQYTYNELCFALDHLYGLKEEHDITSFDRLFIQTGLWEKLLSENAADTYRGLMSLTMSNFADLHSAAIYFSVRTGGDTGDQETNAMEWVKGVRYGQQKMQENQGKYLAARAAYYPETPPGYEEVGNTAYITFDMFMIDTKGERDYYNTEITNSTDDTVNLLLYANSQLHREGCPIENVVIDLTCNSGGYAEAAMCVAAWFLGETRFSLEDTLTGTQATTLYEFDANLDREFNEDTDSVSDKNLFCLISPNSFSCGNLIPAIFKDSTNVTLIGQTSGGGACAVQAMTAADGTQFQISGPLRINTVTNGSYYNVDQGVTPDFTISNISHFYDRQYMTDFINNLP